MSTIDAGRSDNDATPELDNGAMPLANMNTDIATRFSRFAAMGALCAAALNCAVLPLHAAEADICTNMSGEQLRRCIEAASRPAPAPRAAPANAQPAPGLAPVVPGTQSRAVSDPKRPLDCTRMLKPDQLLCVTRNEALIACRDSRKYPDNSRCTGDILARAQNPVPANCNGLPKEGQAFCQKRNKVFSACLGDRMNYFACLENQMAAR